MWSSLTTSGQQSRPCSRYEPEWHRQNALRGSPFTAFIPREHYNIASELLFGNLARMQKRPAKSTSTPNEEFFRWDFESGERVTRDSMRLTIELLQDIFFWLKGARGSKSHRMSGIRTMWSGSGQRYGALRLFRKQHKICFWLGSIPNPPEIWTPSSQRLKSWRCRKYRFEVTLGT